MKGYKKNLVMTVKHGEGARISWKNYKAGSIVFVPESYYTSETCARASPRSALLRYGLGCSVSKVDGGYLVYISKLEKKSGV